MLVSRGWTRHARYPDYPYIWRKNRNMTKALAVALLASLAFSCAKKTDDHAHHHAEPAASAAASADPNKPLFDSVMHVHDEVMPKMDEMYKLSETLKNKIAQTPQLAAERKKELDEAILALDHASEGMMAWMRQFKPVSDSSDTGEARRYLQEEMVKVTQVKTDMLSAIERAKALQ